MQITQEPVIGYLLEWHCEIIWEQYLSNGTYSTVRNHKRAREIGNRKNIYNYCTQKQCTAHSFTNNVIINYLFCSKVITENEEGTSSASPFLVKLSHKITLRMHKCIQRVKTTHIGL